MHEKEEKQRKQDMSPPHDSLRAARPLLWHRGASDDRRQIITRGALHAWKGSISALQPVCRMSALPSMATIPQTRRYVSDVPTAAVSRCSKNLQSNARRGQQEGLDLIIPCWD